MDGLAVESDHIKKAASMGFEMSAGAAAKVAGPKA